MTELASGAWPGEVGCCAYEAPGDLARPAGESFTHEPLGHHRHLGTTIAPSWTHLQHIRDPWTDEGGRKKGPNEGGATPLYI